MNKLFNTPFEIGLRAMLILYVLSPSKISITRTISYDFITIYGNDFGVSKNNLHGENHFNFSELSCRKADFSKALKLFVLYGLIAITPSTKGMTYSLTPTGKTYVESLESNYKVQYIEILNKVKITYGGLSDTEITNLINNTAIKALRR